MRLLAPFFVFQRHQGLSFRDYPRDLIDPHLVPLSANQRRLFLCALARWLRFLNAQHEPLCPERPELPGGPVGQAVRKPVTVVLQAPESWPISAGNLYERFRARLKQRLRHPRVILQLLRPFLAAQERLGLTFREFPTHFVQGYLAELRPDPRRSTLRALRQWWRFLFAQRELLLPLHEETWWKFSRPRQRAARTHEQILQVLALPPLDEPAGIRDRAMLEVAYATGMRAGELIALDLIDLDLAEARVTIRQPKNGRQRTAPLTEWALRYLKLYLAKARPQLTSLLSSNALWLNPAGQRVNLNLLGNRLKRIYRSRETLGFTFTLHQLRHACATQLLEAGAPLRQVQELLGHQDLNSTQIYTHLTPVGLREVHRRCHPRNNGSFAAIARNDL